MECSGPAPIKRPPVTEGVRNPIDPRRRVKAILFDLDGTLYRQRRLRVLMALELIAASLFTPWRARRRVRALRAYRHAHEQLRRMTSAICTSETQLEIASEQSGIPVVELRQVVAEWMLTRPNKYLPWCRADGIPELLTFLESKGVDVGVLSDYPPRAKLAALRLDGRFSVVLCSTDSGLAALKPNPRGFLRACAEWRLDPSEVLVVGDRPDADAAGAAAAGMPCVIINGSTPRAAASHLSLPSLEGLRSALDDAR